VTDAPKEISLEVEDKLDPLKKRIEAAISQGSGIIWLTDKKGKQVGVPAAKVAYVEIDPENTSRSVGFAR